MYLNENNPARFFFALFVMGSSNLDSDTTWNEVDVGFGASPTDPVYFSAAYFNPDLKMKRFSNTTTLKFSQSLAQGWHNYSLLWTPTSLTYFIDGKIYWSQTNSATVKVPWRCASYRFILRTDGGLSTPASDDFVYLRRFKYTTLETYKASPTLGSPYQIDDSAFGLFSIYKQLFFTATLFLIGYSSLIM